MPNATTYSIHQIVSYGPICASDKDSDILVTRNGSYLQAWFGDFQGHYVDDGGVRGLRGMHKDLYKATGSEMLDEAQEFLKEMLQPEDEDE